MIVEEKGREGLIKTDDTRVIMLDIRGLINY